MAHPSCGNFSLVPRLPQALHQPWGLPKPLLRSSAPSPGVPQPGCLLVPQVLNSTAVFVPNPLPCFLLIFVSLAPSTGSGLQYFAW